MAQTRRRLFSAFGISVTVHACALVILIVLASMTSEQVDTRTPPIRTDLVFLQAADPSTGGGGGGTSAPAAPAKLEIPPPQPPTNLAATAPPPVDPPPPSLDAPVQTTNATVLLGGGITLGAPPGPGGNGPGRGGLGDGDGPGLDKGKDGGTGGGTRNPPGMTPPKPIRSVKPEYTSQAMQARLQGSVTLEVEVLANGTVGAVRILKSLDSRYGLDGQAIRCAKQWLFAPGTVNGKAVDSLVQLVLEFNLR